MSKSPFCGQLVPFSPQLFGYLQNVYSLTRFSLFFRFQPSFRCLSPCRNHSVNALIVVCPSNDVQPALRHVPLSVSMSWRAPRVHLVVGCRHQLFRIHSDDIRNRKIPSLPVLMVRHPKTLNASMCHQSKASLTSHLHTLCLMTCFAIIFRKIAIQKSQKNRI